MSLFKGSGVAIITPFNDRLVDFKRLGELLEWHIASGTDAIIICGTTGEASTMSEVEKKSTIKFTVDQVNKRIPVIAGTGSNDTMRTIELSLWAESIGVDGLLIITPYYNKTSQRGIYHHFKAIAEKVSLPIIIYNVPSRTGLNILPETLKELTEIKNIAAVKEASGDISQIAKIKLLCEDKLLIYSGNDDQTLPIMSLGGSGVISVLANILPKEVHELCSAYLSGDIVKALKIQLSTLALTNALFIEPNPIPVKTAMNLMGMKVGGLRLPLYEMGDKTKILEDELKAYGLI
ncbi:MAG TPA: 4-hydroxy-tetrahydrodipicolinate synthase [Clostridiaceae bacterium]